MRYLPAAMGNLETIGTPVLFAGYGVTETGEIGTKLWVDGSLSDVTATGLQDYVPTKSSLYMPAGTTSGRISIAVHGDAIDEGISESFSLNILEAFNAGIADNTGEGGMYSVERAEARQLLTEAGKAPGTSRLVTDW